MKKWVENRTVAVIGNAKSLFLKDYGKEIDEHDIVIRINRGIEAITFRGKSHGKKIDIWCFNLYSSLSNLDRIMSKNIPQTYKRMQMNYSPILGKFDATISKEETEEIRNIFAPMKASTGFRVLYCLSHYHPTKVNVYGFDWKETPTYYMGGNNNIDLNHDFKTEKMYCEDHFFSDQRFELKK